eukprot:Gregarina_sp_Pseudo_9__2633@NODE_2891_length_834_cov_592_759748_g2644_i0_p1_GENE_NODE_2891_length_834_cov_592_759748_g2644_i0NODE_2891_length_834_cov_592_759748_g2644_i0_p1_ORF_typecomplete_len227_score6_29_NODE_2891_length_834_cov_592_759748_g2644_i0154774
MKFLTLFAFSLTWAEQGPTTRGAVYTDFNAVPWNGEQCAACDPKGAPMTHTEILFCLREVPEFCEYTVQTSNVTSGLPEVCKTGHGFTLEWAMGVFLHPPSYHFISSLTGGVLRLELDVISPKTCVLSYQISRVETCDYPFPADEGVMVTFVNGYVEMLMQPIKNPGLSMIFQVVEGGEACGSRFSAVYMTDGAAIVRLKGMAPPS